MRGISLSKMLESSAEYLRSNKLVQTQQKKKGNCNEIEIALNSFFLSSVHCFASANSGVLPVANDVNDCHLNSSVYLTNRLNVHERCINKIKVHRLCSSRHSFGSARKKYVPPDSRNKIYKNKIRTEERTIRKVFIV